VEADAARGPGRRDVLTGPATSHAGPLSYVVIRLRILTVKSVVCNLRAGQTRRWTADWFSGHGLHQSRGTIRDRKAA
jgi:hypothetical protein